VRAGRAYKDLFEHNYQRVKSRLLLSDGIEWFFLSGGYGIIHALEEARKYQATFNKGIAYQNKVPFTAGLWNGVLVSICDAVISKLCPEWIYVFGSRDYIQFIKQTDFWKKGANVKIFESTGSAGTSWLSPIINTLVNSILSDNIDVFNNKYEKFNKQ
jgi:hypothetical protein